MLLCLLLVAALPAARAATCHWPDQAEECELPACPDCSAVLCGDQLTQAVVFTGFLVLVGC